MEFYGITETLTSTFREKGSKFISYVIPVRDDEEIQLALKTIRSKYPDATHHCYAWRVAPEHLREFSHDDGEPSGSAGLPILGRLKSHQLINVLGIVVRYYGGTNLGKSGLVKAYSYGIDLTMTDIKTIPIKAYDTFSITYPYHESKLIEQIIGNYNVLPGDITYLQAVSGEYHCPSVLSAEFSQRLQELKWCGIMSTKKQRIHLMEHEYE